MKNICFVLNGNLPVPAVRGGAIESLVEMLVKENEVQRTYDFTIVGPYDEKTDSLKPAYHQTTFVDIRYSRSINQRLGTIRAIINKLFHRDFALLSLYNYKVEQYLLKHGSDFDYIVNEHADDGLFLLPAKKFGKEKFVNHLHMVTKANTTIHRAFHNYISVSYFVKDYFIASSNPDSKSNHSVLYNRVELEKFNKELETTECINIRKQLGFSCDDFVIAYCGRIKDFKGVKELVDAVLSINNEHIKLMIIGSSETHGMVSHYEKEIKTVVECFSNRITFTGYINNTDLYKYYKISDVGVIPTVCEEAFNMVILEMMASGVPTIATKSGGMVEVGDDTTTRYIEKDDKLVENIKEAVVQLYQAADQRANMTRAAKQRALLFDSRCYLNEFQKAIDIFGGK